VSKLPPGLYDLPVTHAIEHELRQLDRERFGVDEREFDAADADLAFARHLAAVVRQALASVPPDDRVLKQAQIVNELLASLETIEGDDHLALPPRRLASIHRIDALRGAMRPGDPLIPLAQSDLLVNGRGEPAVGSAIQREIDSADRVDLLCAFIKWHGLRLLEEPLDAYLRTGRKLRVITTTYIGATERKAIDRLVDLGADVKVSYQTDHTRLHAKGLAVPSGKRILYRLHRLVEPLQVGAARWRGVERTSLADRRAHDHREIRSHVRQLLGRSRLRDLSRE
jgi:hypothetical protein